MLGPLLSTARRLLLYGQPSLVFSHYRPSLQGERREIVCCPSAACPTCAVAIGGSWGTRGTPRPASAQTTPSSPLGEDPRRG